MPRQTFFSTFDYSQLSQENYRRLQAIAHAFVLIYRGLYAAQDNTRLIKTNFLYGREHLKPLDLVKEIKHHIEEAQGKSGEKAIDKPMRTLEAWRLANLHFQNCRCQNVALFNAIYKFGYDNTRYAGITYFSSPSPAPVFTEEQILKGEHLQDRLGLRIAQELDYSPKHYEVMSPRR